MLTQKLCEAFPDRPRPYSTMPVKVVKGTCNAELEAGLTSMGAWGQPIFANLDSWGNAPVPYKLLQRLGQNIASEVIVTLLPQHFVRFVSEMGDSGDEVFGGDPSWRDVAGMAPATKSRHILTCYRNALQAAGFPFILDFELVPRSGQSLYLVFGTTHKLGVEKMKDSLWEVDRTGGVGFRDPRDEQAETLFAVDKPQLGPLTRLLEHKLQEGGAHRVNDLRDWALLETVYRPQHVIAALKPLKDQGTLLTDPPGPLRLSTQVGV